MAAISEGHASQLQIDSEETRVRLKSDCKTESVFCVALDLLAK